MGEFSIAIHIAVFVVAWRNDVRDFVVQSFEAMRAPFPHLPTALVLGLGTGIYVIIAVDHVSSEKHGFDVEWLHVVGHPNGTQFENGLIEGILYVVLRVAHHNHGKRFGVIQFLGVSPMLGTGSEGQE